MSEANHIHSVDPLWPSPTRRGDLASVTPIVEARCSLCGVSLPKRRERHQMVSPLAAMGKVTLCRTCAKASISEGYRPA